MSVNTAFETSDLPKAEFMFPGPERDRLVKLILDGAKTATAALMIEYEEEVEPLPCVGAHSVLVDSDERPVAVLVTTAVDVIPLGKVTDRYAIDEGEGTSRRPNGGAHTNLSGIRRNTAMNSPTQSFR